MSETADVESLTIDLQHYPEGCGKVELRQVAPGMQPLVLIEPDDDATDEDTGVLGLKVTVSALDLDEASFVLESVAKALNQDAGSAR